MECKDGDVDCHLNENLLYGIHENHIWYNYDIGSKLHYTVAPDLEIRWHLERIARFENPPKHLRAEEEEYEMHRQWSEAVRREYE